MLNDVGMWQTSLINYHGPIHCRIQLARARPTKKRKVTQVIIHWRATPLRVTFVVLRDFLMKKPNFCPQHHIEMHSICHIGNSLHFPCASSNNVLDYQLTSLMVCVGITSTSEGAVSMESEMSVLSAISKRPRYDTPSPRPSLRLECSSMRL